PRQILPAGRVARLGSRDPTRARRRDGDARPRRATALGPGPARPLPLRRLRRPLPSPGTRMRPVTGIRAAWALLAADAAALAVTYWRLPPAATYHVSLSGFDGAASRVVVFFCFPTALAAIAILGLVVERLPGRWSGPIALAALLLCA